jgi:hypothetical protein
MMDGRDWYKNHTLNPKVIEYVVDKAIKHDKKLIEIVTNRLQDEEVSA